MVSPVISEELMATTLQTPVSATNETAARLQLGATLLVLDAFDRKATRNQFIDALAAAVGLVDATGRHAVLGTVAGSPRMASVTTAPAMEKAIKELANTVSDRAAKCIKLAELIMQCALDEDKVH